MSNLFQNKIPDQIRSVHDNIGCQKSQYWFFHRQVGQIAQIDADELEISQSSTSHCLGALKAQELVSGRREGTAIFYLAVDRLFCPHRLPTPL